MIKSSLCFIILRFFLYIKNKKNILCQIKENSEYDKTGKNGKFDGKIREGL